VRRGWRRRSGRSASRRTSARSARQFSQATIEWQIWIDAGDTPLPRKLVISYVQEPGEPQYSATMRRWNLESKVPEGLFTFEAPEGAQKIDATAMTGGR